MKTNLLVRSQLLVSILALCAGPGNGRCGMFVVNNLSDSGVGSLRQALLDANAGSGGNVIFSGVSGAILLLSPLPDIVTNVDIIGPGTNLLTIDGNSHRIFVVRSNANVTIRDMTAQNGRNVGTNGAAGSVGGDGLGGGLLNDKGSVTLLNCRFRYNVAAGGVGGQYTGPGLEGKNGGTGYGGAIFNDGGALNVTNCAFSGNSVYGGTGGIGSPTGVAYGGTGGTASGSAIYNNEGTLNLTGCLFSGNAAAGGYGGSGTWSAGNGGSASGGAIYSHQGVLGVWLCVFSGNSGRGGNGGPTAEGLGGYGGFASGGAVCLNGGTNTLSTTVFSENATSGGEGSKKEEYGYPDGGRDGNGSGGAIATAVGGSTHIVGSTFLYNEVTGADSANSGQNRGGGIYHGGGIMNIMETAFSANLCVGGDAVPQTVSQPSYGGALFNNATLTLTNCTLTGNWSKAGSGGQKGSSGSSFNHTAQGGAIYSVGSLLVVGCQLSGNSVQGGTAGQDSLGNYYAGGAALGGGIWNGNSLTILNSTCSSNVVIGGMGGGGVDGRGGGIFNQSICNLTNATFYTNVAVGGFGRSGYPGGNGDGGAVCSVGGTVNLIHCTLSRNSAYAGGGTYGTGLIRGGSVHSSGTTFTWRNSIVANSVSGSNIFGAVLDAGYNISSDASCLLTNVGSHINMSPQLGPLADNGGTTLTLALLPGSPAIDQGTTDGVFADQRGVTRPYDVAAIPNLADGSDIGAFELIALAPPDISGSVRVWGANDFGQTNGPGDPTSAIAISAGTFHSLALKADSTVVGWGQNTYGETNAPAGLSNVMAIAAGWSTSFALKQDGTVREWGWDGYGLRDTAETLTNVMRIAATWDCGMALKGDSSVFVWGKSTHGETNIPTGLSNVAAIAGGGYFCMALKGDGTIAVWGSNYADQTNVPAGLSDIVAIAAGGDHCLALKSDHSVIAWGANSYGQTNVPADLTDVVAISAGYYHSLALRGDGTVAAWGNNSYGQTNVPANLTNVVAISAGGFHNLALIGIPSHSLKLTNVGRAHNGQIQFDISGPPGDVFRVLASTNLLNWETVATITNITGTVQFTDTDTASFERRFYRCVMP